MESIERGRARLWAAAIGLVVVVLAYAAAQASVAGQATAPAGRDAPSGRSSRALAVEGEIAGTAVVERTKAAIGNAFAGAWFEGSTAQLHIGVTSAASRQSAEAVAAQTGLAEGVVETPVRSTWAQLEAAQERWNRRLADLFAREEVATALRARYNAVEVELSSKVDPSERAVLEREAAAADVNISIVTASQPRLRVERDSRCNEFKTTESKCNSTVVAGVTIQSQAGNKCTAGPAVFSTDPAKPTETYILTAGHCIQNGGGNGKKWYVYPKEGEKESLGVSVDYINGKKADVGVISVENVFWTNKGFTPQEPTIAPWDEAPEPEPYAVAGESEPVEGIESCMSGGSTGTSCGKILKLGVTVLGTEGLVEVEAARESGDSGAPWYAKGHREIVEGTHVGFIGANAAFEPLATSFKELTTKLQLLTSSNKARHPFGFVAESAPVTLTGKQHAGSAEFGTTAGTLKCTEATYSGSISEKEVLEFEMSPSYFGCTAFGLMTASIDVNECKYRFKVKKIEGGNREGSADLVCPAGKEITATASMGGVTKCTIHVPSQSNLGTVTYKNIGTGTTREITIELNISGLKYAHTAGSGLFACTSGAAENGTFKTMISVKGESGGKHVGVFTS
jgi:hypothetical protein